MHHLFFLVENSKLLLCKGCYLNSVQAHIRGVQYTKMQKENNVCFMTGFCKIVTHKLVGRNSFVAVPA